MNWVLFLLLLGWSAIPSFLLMADRILDIDSNRVIRRGGLAVALGSIALLVVAGATSPRYLELVGWGALVGLIGTVTLDIVRLIGVRANAFPLDMPLVFGFMALGKARLFQANVMGQVLHDAVRTGRVKEFVAARIRRLSDLSERQRVNAAAAMMGAISTLDDASKEEVAEAQFAALNDLSEDGRRKVMAAMDEATVAVAPGQPRGLPRVEFHDFRRAADAAVAKLDATQRHLMRSVRSAGYGWHAINGASFGVGYALLFGQGNWGWAFGWGVLVWLAMMVSMPLMMPVLKLPGWFPIVPLIAHFAMVAPFAALMAWVSSTAHEASLLGWLF